MLFPCAVHYWYTVRLSLTGRVTEKESKRLSQGSGFWSIDWQFNELRLPAKKSKGSFPLILSTFSQASGSSCDVFRKPLTQSGSSLQAAVVVHTHRHRHTHTARSKGSKAMRRGSKLHSKRGGREEEEIENETSQSSMRGCRSEKGRQEERRECIREENQNNVI